MLSKIILITGGNRGIGFGTVQALCQKSSDNTIILASRKRTDAEEAIREAQKLGCTNLFHPLALDVASDESVDAAVEEISDIFGRLDVLINNAGLGLLEDQSSTASWRSAWNRVYDTNVTSVRIVTYAFLPLLRKACNGAAPPMVINVSSVRGSFARANGNPPTASIPYSVSKAALNLLTLEMAKVEPELSFYAVSPGNCKTAFNDYRGVKDPVDGGRCAAGLAVAEGHHALASGFWEFEEGEMRTVGW